MDQTLCFCHLEGASELINDKERNFLISNNIILY